MSSTDGTPMGRPFRPGLFDLNPAGDPYLNGCRCARCGAAYFPSRDLCVACLEDGRMETVALTGRGTLYTFTVVRQGLPSFVTPYIVGYIDLPEGVRVFAQLTGCTPEALRIGMTMDLILAPLLDEQGEPLWGYKFSPVPVDGTGEVSQA